MTTNAKTGRRQGTPISRRHALAAGLAAASAAVVARATRGGGGEPASARDRESTSTASRMPVIFLPHGGGPWPFVELGMGEPDEVRDLAAYLRSIREVPKTQPKALLVISAHWEERVPTVMTAAQPPMLYDYYGFPPESYQITWPAPGDPSLAMRVRNLLEDAGFASAEDPRRGFDHGTFVPLKVTWPEAAIPTVQLSLVHGFDPEEHLAIGRALAPLRDEAVLIIGSGMTYHNLRRFGPAGRPDAEAFDAWLRHAALLEPHERDPRLVEWERAPSARAAHPREEHLLPLIVIAGAAGGSRGALAWNGTFAGLRLSAYHFG